jgi:hypothetical protein
MDADRDEDCRATRVSAFVKPNMLEVDVEQSEPQNQVKKVGRQIYQLKK